MVSTNRTKQDTRQFIGNGSTCFAALLAMAFIAIPAAGHAQLSGQEQKCIGALTKDGSKVSKFESKLQQKCMKDKAAGKLTVTTDQCIADDGSGKVLKATTKTIADETKHCFDGTGFVTATGAQTNIASRAQTLEVAHDLFGTDLDAVAQTEKADIKCQQKVQKAVDKVLATKIKSYAKCAKLAAKLETTVDLAPFETCLIDIPGDAKVIKLVAKLNATRLKSCDTLPLGTIFPGICAGAATPGDFDICADAVAECRACTVIAGMNGLPTDCDLFDNGIDDNSCADVAPFCGDGNVDPGEQCDPGAEPTCCSATCTNNSDGLSCDDGTFCNGVDTCSSGVCVSPGDPCASGAECNVTCNEATDDCFDPAATGCTDDGNVCTDDECDGAGTCAHPNNTLSCDDGDACTTVDVCGGGTCNGSAPPDCDDGNVCTNDVCLPASGCLNINNADPCDDGLYCNGADNCDEAGGCTIHAGDPCLANGECNVVCNEGPDTCFDAASTACTDDGNPCTDDICDGAGGCTHPNNTAPCDDGNACTTVDVCGGGTCNGSVPPDCSDGNVCTDDVCVPATGCTNPDNSAPCDDGTFCNGADTCSGGSCSLHAGDPCLGGAECNVTCNEGAGNCFDLASTACTSDGNLCTDDFCDGAGTCTNTNNTIPCDDGNACTTVDVCGGGTCNGSVPPDCSDGNVCTDDVCVPATGCTNPNNSAGCDDGMFCNGADTCSGGSCSVHAGDPCSGGAQCNNFCNEGPDNCYNSAATTCDNGVAGPNDNCDVTTDLCNGSGTCVNSDPAQIPEQCYTVGDEDCDGFADTADTDPDSECQANGIQTCTCADACTVGRVVPAASGATSLAGLTPLTGEGSVSTSISASAVGSTSYGSNTGTSYTHTLSGVPANLSLWLGFTGNAGHNDDFSGSPNVSQFRFAAGDSNAQSGGDFISEGPAANGGTGSALTEPTRTDGLPILANISCSASTATSLELERTSGPGTSWTAWGTPFPTSALTPALQSEQSNFLTATRLMPITGNGSLVTRMRLQLAGAAMSSAYEVCHTNPTGWGYGINLTAAIYGSYRNANVCP